MLYIFTLLFSFAAISAEVGFSYKEEGNVHYVVPYEIAGKWMVDEYQVAPGKLQQRISQKIYNNSVEWNKYIENFKSNKKMKSADFLTEAKFVETEDPRAVVWTTNANWDMNWEIRFQQWVKNNVGPTFFRDNNIATDCADVMFSLRWIFARMNYLSIGNTLAGSRKLFSNESFVSSWSNLRRDDDWRRDQVFMAALNYILDNTYTGTLYEDSIPVRISPTTFAEGNFFLTMRGAQAMGHTEVVFNIDQNPGKINIMFSDVPRRPRVLYTSASYPNSVDPYRFSLRSLKWIKKNNLNKWIFTPVEQHPHYSQEQFTPEFRDGFDRLYNAIFYRLGISYDYQRHYTSLRDRLLSLVTERVNVVRDGFQFCMNNNCDPGTANYELWSTPSRDQKIVESFTRINEVLQLANIPALVEAYNQLLNGTEIIITPNNDLRLIEIKEKFENQEFTSDPRDQVLVRWGI